MVDMTGRLNLKFIHQSLNELEAKVYGKYDKGLSLEIRTFYDKNNNEFDAGAPMKLRVQKHVKNNPSSVFPKSSKLYKKIKYQDKGDDGMYNIGGSARSGL